MVAFTAQPCYFSPTMTVAIDPKLISPVDVNDRKNLDIRAGDVVRIHQKIQEKGKTRIQMYEGLVIARKHGTEAGATFTVRATLSGIGVEKIFPLYSPLIDKIEIVRRSKVRRAKLYYIRDKVSREVRRQLRRMSLVNLSTGAGDADDAADTDADADSAEAVTDIAEAEKDTSPIEAAAPSTPEEKTEAETAA